MKNFKSFIEDKKGLYYYVNKRKKAGTSRDKDHPDAPSAQDWKNAAKTAKKEAKAGDCPDGQYYCQRTLTCKPIPKGMMKNADGFLVKESSAEYSKSIDNINKKKRDAMLKPGEKEKIDKIRHMMKKAND